MSNVTAIKVTPEPDTATRFRKVIAETFGYRDPDKFTDDSRFVDDMQLHDLDRVQLCSEVEHEFSIVLHDEQWFSAETISDAVQLIERARAG